MTMPLASVAPAGGGFGLNGTSQQIHDQEKLRIVADGSVLSAEDAAADNSVAKAETAQAVRPTPDSAAAVKVDIDPDRRPADGEISYPITGPDEFARKVGEQTSQARDSAREAAAEESRQEAAADARSEDVRTADDAASASASEPAPVADQPEAVATTDPAADVPETPEDAAAEAVAGGAEPSTPGFG